MNRVPTPDPRLFTTPQTFAIAWIGGLAVVPDPDDASRAAAAQAVAAVTGTPALNSNFCVCIAIAAVELIASRSTCSSPDCKGVHQLAWARGGALVSIEEAVEDPAERAVLRAFVACVAGDDEDVLTHLETLDPGAPATVAAHIAAFGQVARAITIPVGAPIT